MQTLSALYSTYDEAKRVMDELNNAGFSREDVSIIANDVSGKYSGTVEVRKEEAVTGGEGAGFGATIGSIVGVGFGLGALAIPGIGAVIAAGPLLAALGVVGGIAGGATGGLVGALVKTNKITEEDAAIFAEGVRRGNALVIVSSRDEDVVKAQDIMGRESALNIRQLAENWRSSGWNSFDDKSTPYSPDEIDSVRGMPVVPVSATTSSGNAPILGAATSLSGLATGDNLNDMNRDMNTSADDRRSTFGDSDATVDRDATELRNAVSNVYKYDYAPVSDETSDLNNSDLADKNTVNR